MPQNFKFPVLSRPVFELKVNQAKSKYLKVSQGKKYFTDGEKP